MDLNDVNKSCEEMVPKSTKIEAGAHYILCTELEPSGLAHQARLS